MSVKDESHKPESNQGELVFIGLPEGLIIESDLSRRILSYFIPRIHSYNGVT